MNKRQIEDFVEKFRNAVVEYSKLTGYYKRFRLKEMVKTPSDALILPTKFKPYQRIIKNPIIVVEE